MCKLTQRIYRVVVTTAACVLALIGQAQAGQDSGAMAPTPIYLEQGWSDADRQDYYHLTQGSQLLPYDWLLALEQTDSERLFVANAHLRTLGYLTQEAASRRNPDALPIGFALDDNPGTAQMSYAMKKAFLGVDYQIEQYPSTNRWFGFTCAACHTSEIRYQGKTLRIDGGPPLIDHEGFLNHLADALKATQSDEAKFTRFAKRVLADNHNAGEAAALKQRLAAYTGTLVASVERNWAEHAYGMGRLDAFGAILNQVTETALEIPENHRISNAPVSFPFLWDTPHLDWVQWNGAVANPLGRNVGEVLGVYGHLKLTGTPQQGQFNSTVNIQNLDRLEQTLSRLGAPAWPEQHLGPIDPVLAKQGKALYAANCMGCHSLRDDQGQFPLTAPNRFGKQFIRTRMIALEKIGTDPTMVLNFATRTAKPGALRPYLDEALRDAPEVPAGILLTIASGGVIKNKFAAFQPPLDAQQQLELTGHRDPAVGPPNVVAYKARPLDGIWATAPYLHNGSVPNLYQLLLPADQRMTHFNVGHRDFDPVAVGFITDPHPLGFEFRVADMQGKPIPGNANTGHSGKLYTQTRDPYGDWRDFTKDERWALVEFMKTLN